MYPHRFKSALAICLIALAAAALAACGGSSSSSQKGSTGKNVGLETPKSGCGSLQLPTVEDADGVVKSLPTVVQENYQGLSLPVTKSNWQNFKPKGAPPYNVAVVWGPATPGFNNIVGAAVVKRLKQSPVVGSVTYKTMGPEVNVPTALANVNNAIAQKADIIILEPMLSVPFIAAANNAAKAGIPVVAVQAAIDSPNVVNVGPNLVKSAAEADARLFRVMGEKGNVLRVQGIPGVPSNEDALTAEKLALKNCPNIKVTGEVYGAFATATAKSEVLKYLGTHPAKIDGVLQAGTMANGIMAGFQQVGRPMPVVNDIGPNSGSMAYWAKNRGKYFGVGDGMGPAQLGAAAANVALRMLEGQGAKLTFITQSLPTINEKNLDQWATDKSATFTSVSQPEGPPNSFLNDEYINPMFVNGAPPRSK